MTAGPAPEAAALGIEVEIEEPAWSVATPDTESLTRAAVRAALNGRCEPNAAVCVLLTDDATLRDLNKRFRGQDLATNVLAFPVRARDAEPASAGTLGDVALAFGVCAREAAEQGKVLADHLRHLTVHGVLHLLGYDHQAQGEAERMEALEREILAGLGVADPYA